MIFKTKYIDYTSKSKVELYQTLILFYILSNKNIVFFSKILLRIALKLKLPILGLIKKTVFTHFCGGEDIKESKKKIIELGKYNIKTILDYSVEGLNNNVQFQHTYLEILKNLKEASNNKNIPFCVFKITGIARFKLLEKLNRKLELSHEEKEELLLLRQRLNSICIQASTNNTPILIDAEESWIQNAIDELTEELMENYNVENVIIYNTVQLYRWDKLAYIKKLHSKSKNKFKLGLKLVRGAYMEKERAYAIKLNQKCLIHDTKENCDKDYNIASKYCVKNINDISLCFGTHNEQSTEIVIDLMKKHNISNTDERIFFSQLLGMSDNISFYLGQYNYNVAKYVPYGPVKKVLPYLIRRAEENSSITGQTNREIIRIKEAIKNQ